MLQSINSMFQYYRQAIVCYAYLEDFPEGALLKGGLSQCRWFTRGWTLQELLAPGIVEFYAQGWKFVGTKHEQAAAISRFTNIPEAVLTHARRDIIAEQSVSARMSWASQRRTKRKEDMAYSLLGIFDVNMPLIYGEGNKAFRRLQEEIIKRDNDLSIFAWNSMSEYQNNDLVEIFASSPAAFEDVFNASAHKHQLAEFSVTNRGLLLGGDFEIYGWYSERGYTDIPKHYVLLVGESKKDDSSIGIFLRKCGPGLFCRIGGLPLARLPNKIITYSAQELMTSVYLSTDAFLKHSITRLVSFRHDGLHIPVQEHLRMRSVAPLHAWDHLDRTFLVPKAWDQNVSQLVLAAQFSVTIAGYTAEIVVICPAHKDQTPIVFLAKDYLRETRFLFADKVGKEGILWEDLVKELPKLPFLNKGHVYVKPKHAFKISVGLQRIKIDTDCGPISVRSLTSSVTAV
ncbi:hypothetical protein J4E81_010741 [Alternaria sp. BMP 2799]|nr:hypothetical protein J4E81_010741 [Alternaria sp. BMP 2799]